jgi:hypothetical protein
MSAEALHEQTEALRRKNIPSVATSSQKLEPVLEWEDEDATDSDYDSDSSEDDDSGSLAWVYRVAAASGQVRPSTMFKILR